MLAITAGDGLQSLATPFLLTSASGGIVIENAELAVKLDATSITGTLAVSDGGTGATSASAARTNLGVAIGSDVQAYDAQLADVAGLSVTDGGFIVGDGSNFVLETGSTARASLGVSIGSRVQAYDADLDAPLVNGWSHALAALTATEIKFLMARQSPPAS